MRRQSVDPHARPTGAQQPWRRRDRVQSVLALQRAAGNQAVAGLFRTPAGEAATGTPAKSKPLFLVTMKGTKQGLIKGGGPGNAIEGLKYGMGVSSPRDVATGHASGGRTHKAITFTKPWDAASPQLMSAVDENEMLTQVKSRGDEDLAGDAQAGGVPDDHAHERVHRVVRQHAQNRFHGGDRDWDTSSVEVIALAYQTLTFEHAEAKTSAVDDWTTGR